MSVTRLTATGVQVLDAGGQPAARLSGMGVQVLDAGGTPNARLTGLGAQVLVLDPDYVPVPGKVSLLWDGDEGDTHTIYHARAPMDVGALPTPVASVPAAQGGYDHIGAFEQVGAHYYRIGAVNAAGETLSDEIAVEAALHVNAGLDVVIVTDDVGNSAPLNTRQALIDAGFDAERITLVAEAGTIPAGDVIVVCRGVDTQADADKVLAHWNAGIPVVWGSTHGSAPGTGRSMGSTFAGLTGTVEVVSSTAGVDGEDVTDATHYITSPFGVGQAVVFTGANWSIAVDSGASFVGAKLADGDPDSASLAGQASLIAVEAGTPDLLGAPTPARAVVWGNIYGGQAAYNANGQTLLSRIVQWCLGYDEHLS